MKTMQISVLIVGTASLLFILLLTLQPRAEGSLVSDSKNRLSPLLVDTEFLAHCAQTHRKALEHNPLIHPDISAAALQLVSAHQ
jgi:hypothetical protein